jgi:hypothetical protein
MTSGSGRNTEPEEIVGPVVLQAGQHGWPSAGASNERDVMMR